MSLSSGLNLADLPGPAQHYMTPAMANNRYRTKGIAYPISGDHTARAQSSRAKDISVYIEIAQRK